MTRDSFEAIVRAQFDQVLAVQGLGRVHLTDEASRRYERAVERIAREHEAAVKPLRDEIDRRNADEQARIEYEAGDDL